MTDPGPKRLDEMDDLRDMGRFPVPIYVGATSNILLTICLTYLLRGRFGGPLALPAWAVGIISANVLPVVALGSRMDEGTEFPPVEERSLFGDEHRFSIWVYAVASGTCSSKSCSPKASSPATATAGPSPVCSSSRSCARSSRRG